MKLVSMSIYGDGEMYLKGVVKNASLIGRVYPGWFLRIYCERTLDRCILRRLGDLGAEVIPMGMNRGHSGMLWRFLPAWEPKIERVIFRDADSRLNNKEAAAVASWIDSGKDAHCMHDHRHHASMPLFGGMWGVKGGVLKGACPFAPMFTTHLPRVGDMRLLNRFILPQIKGSLLRHSSVPIRKEWGEYHPFPPHKDWPGFVGQQYDEHGKPIVV